MPAITGFSYFFASSGVAQSDFQLLQEPAVWWDFKDDTSLTKTGSSLDGAANKGALGSDYNLFHNSGVKGTVTANDSVTFNGSQNDYRASVAGGFDFLHKGAGAHIFVIYEQDDAANYQAFVNTNITAASSLSGLRFASQQTSSVDCYVLTIGNGTSAFNYQTDNLTLPVGGYRVAEAAINNTAGVDAQIWDDAVSLKTGTGVTFGTGSHADVARFFTSTTGKAKGLLIYDRALTNAEREAIHYKLSSYYNLPALSVSIMLGDSNALGLGAKASLSAAYTAIINRAYMWAYEDGNTANTLSFWPLDKDQTGFDVNTSNTGAELAFMSTLAAASAQKEHLIKIPVSGSDMFASWNPGGEFDAGWEKLLLNINNVKAWAAKYGRSINWRSCWQILGHNDTSQTFRANVYATRLSNLNAAIRANTDASIKMVVTMTSREGLDNPNVSYTDAQYQPTVRAAIQSASNSDNLVYAYQPLNASPLNATWNESTPNGLHYNIACLEDMGENVGQGLTSTGAPSATATINGAGDAEGQVMTLVVAATGGLLGVRNIQWKRNGAAISGANKWQYVLVTADANTDLTVSFTPVNGFGAGAEVTSTAKSVAYVTRNSPLSALVPSVVMDVDATVAASYTSGQVWANLVPSPADGSAQTAYDFTLGASNSVSTDDPTFTGTAGDTAAYWAFDGGDYFQLASTNTEFLRVLARTDFSQPFTMGYIAQGQSPGGVIGLATTNNDSVGGDGVIIWNRIGANTQQFTLVGDTAAVTNSVTGAAAGTIYFIVYSYNPATNTLRRWINTSTKTEASFTRNASVTNPSGRLTIGAAAGGIAPATSGGRMYAAFAANAFLDDADILAIANHYELRHGRNYV